MSNKPQISMIEPVGGHGGMNYYDFGLCSGLAESGFDVTLETCDLTKAPGQCRFKVRNSYKGIFGNKPKWLRGLLYVISTINIIRLAVIENRKICHFHLFNVGLLQTLAVCLAKITMRKVVITAHDVESFVEKLEVPILSRCVYSSADRIIAHNRISFDEITKKLQVSPEKITVIPHGNYLHMLQMPPNKSDARRFFNISDEAKVLLFFGQIKDVKGLDSLINALPDVIYQYRETILIIAGRPWHSTFSVYDNLIKAKGVTPNCITRICYIPDEDVPYYYSAADLVVLPYRHIYQSGVVLMAMSYEKAVLVSDIPGMTEIVNDGFNGFVYNPNDEKGLSNKICQIFANERLLRLVESNALNYITEKHDWNKIGCDVGLLYESITK